MKNNLIVPKKYPENGDKYTREDGAVFVWRDSYELGWEKQ